MDVILLLIILIFIFMIFFRIYHLNKSIYLFGVLQRGKNAIMIRIISFIVMSLIVYGLIFHYLWAFVLFMIDYFIGLSHNIVALTKSRSKVSYDIFMEGVFKRYKRLIPYLPILGIVLWTLIAIYIYKIFVLS